MLSGKTVFILGAGASYTYGFPLGGDLYDLIHNGEYQRLYSDFLENTTIDNQRKSKFMEEANRLAFHTQKASNKSIDYFLSNNSNFLERGKEAISLIMLKYEAISKNIEIDRRQDWITVLFQECMDNIRYIDEYPNNKVSFITFNYDRSFEYFLHQKMVNSYTQEPSYKLGYLLNKLDIHHVYGKIGKLEWQKEKGSGELGYGWDYKNIRLAAIREDIHVMYTERYGQK